MGDHRATIKIKMTMHGKTYKQEWWINYLDDGDGVDRRVKEWFADCWFDARGRWLDQVEEYHAEQRAAETEKSERDELARLKAKYENEPANIRDPSHENT